MYEQQWCPGEGNKHFARGKKGSHLGKEERTRNRRLAGNEAKFSNSSVEAVQHGFCFYKDGNASLQGRVYNGVGGRPLVRSSNIVRKKEGHINRATGYARL